MSFTESLLPSIVRDNHNGLLAVHRTWERTPLTEVAAILNGFAFKSSLFDACEGVPLVRIRDVLSDQTQTKYGGEYDDTYLVASGDLLIGMDGDFHCTIWQGGTALLNQRVCKVTPREDYNQRFLAHVLPGYLKAINDHTSAITVKHLSSRTVTNIPLPLPPPDRAATHRREDRRVVHGPRRGRGGVERAQAKLSGTGPACSSRPSRAD